MKPLYKIIFLCEDSTSLRRAEQLKKTLAANCAATVLVDGYFCEYARLYHPSLRQDALAHATESDMIVISAKGTNSIPGFVQDWMNEVGALRPEKIICAEFIEKTGEVNAPTFHRFIEKWAAQNSDMLFSNLFSQDSTPAFALSPISLASPRPNQNTTGIPGMI